jgi:hypothetical protein
MLRGASSAESFKRWAKQHKTVPDANYPIFNNTVLNSVVEN